jgi:hypothetical protein
MSRKSYRFGGLAAAVLGFAGIATVALAQSAGIAAPDASSQISGSGMMSGSGVGAMGAAMMGGQETERSPKLSITDRLAALKAELNITAGETDAWNSYAAAVTAADNSFHDGVKAAWQPAVDGAITPDQRFDAMSKMVALMKQSYDAKKAAADTLLPHLTQYQQGQASEILPGIAARHGGHGGMMMGGMMMGGMMNQQGW